MLRLLQVSLLSSVLLSAQDAITTTEPARTVVARHAARSHELYRECASRAAALQQAVGALLASPGPASLKAARDAWIHARIVYGETEVLRFHGGPIDAIEPLVNAWPVDETYIDRVAGRPTAGIVFDTKQFPALSAPLLTSVNERGGETNISVGWHAIEFVLWGQDLDPKGPGQRPHTDFLVGTEGAERRRAYLAIVVDLLATQMTSLRDAWAPESAQRRRFEGDVPGSLRGMLAGAAILTAFELCGERLAVAYETRDQEQEHSCFSDTTCADLVANQKGIVAVFRDSGAANGTHDLLGLVRAKDAAAADHLRQCLDATLAAMSAIPAPFDQAFLGADDAPGRRAIRAAMQALDQQAEAITIAGRLLGFDLPLRPGD